jgi:hypothetical protein
MDTAKQTAVQMRTSKLKTLRVQAGQTSAWQVSILEVVEELARENVLFRREIIGLKTEVSQLKNERITV